jgi:hypothetical protein
MVSPEGACAAVYHYGRYSRKIRELIDLTALSNSEA